MLPLLTAATERELRAALPSGTCLHAEAAGQKSARRKSAVLTAVLQLQEHRLYSVNIAGQAWLACITGVGPVNAALAMGLVLAQRPDITAVLNVGLAGTFDLTRAPLGSTIVVSEEIWPEYGLADDTGVDAAGLGFPLWAEDGAGNEAKLVIDRLPLQVDPKPLGLPPLPRVALPHMAGTQAEGIGQAQGQQAMTQGISLTVAGVTNSAARAQRLRQNYAALLENMEGFAVALACARQHVPLVELRTISNVTGSRQPEDRNFPLAFNAMNLFFTTYFTHTQ